MEPGKEPAGEGKPAKMGFDFFYFRAGARFAGRISRLGMTVFGKAGAMTAQAKGAGTQRNRHRRNEKSSAAFAGVAVVTKGGGRWAEQIKYRLNKGRAPRAHPFLFNGLFACSSQAGRLSLVEFFCKSTKISSSMNRINFSIKTKRIACERAGNKCSFPGCGLITSAPGLKSGSVVRIGVASHIHSAAKGGPRGRGGLSDKEIKQPENCIWLCQIHGKTVDANNGEDFTAQTLRSYKMLHEARITGEMQGTYPPVGWIHSLEINKSSFFRAGTKVNFSKLNLLYGENCSGKTTLWKYLLASFGERLLGKWAESGVKDIDLSIDYFRPKPTKISLKVNNKGKINRQLDGRVFAFNPLPIRVICLKTISYSKKTANDDRRFLAETLGLTPQDISGLVKIVNSYPHAKVRNLKFSKDENGRTLHCDISGTVPGLALRMLSGSEQEKVVMELAVAAARLSGEYCPTLLVLDHPFIIFEGWFEHYSHHLLDPGNQFQTIMCIPTQNIDLRKVRWNGWDVIRTRGKIPDITLAQNPK